MPVINLSFTCYKTSCRCMPLNMLKEQKEIIYDGVTYSRQLAGYFKCICFLPSTQEMKTHCFALLHLAKWVIFFVILSFYPPCFKELTGGVQSETCLALLLSTRAPNATPAKYPPWSHRCSRALNALSRDTLASCCSATTIVFRLHMLRCYIASLHYYIGLSLGS